MIKSDRCKQIKKLFNYNKIKYNIIELDLEDNGEALYERITDIAIQNNLPIIYVDGQNLGDWERIVDAINTDKLKNCLQKLDQRDKEI